MDLDRALRQSAVALGVDYYGVAWLETARDAILTQGGPGVARFPRAISLGIALLHPIVDQLPQRQERAVAINYRHHCYDVVNHRLDLAASSLGSALQRAGHDAYPVPASSTVDDERLTGVFSHKMAAHLAGLGWIGKSCLLITPEAGPRVRWATVLTDAPLQVAGEPMDERCGTCSECVDICPVEAFTGQPFRDHEPREVRYDAHKCDRYFDMSAKKTAGPVVCGLCLYVCPFGRRRSGTNDRSA